MDNAALQSVSAPAAAAAAAERPQKVGQYVEWAKEALGVDLLAPRVKNRCETNIQAILTAFQQTDFYNELEQILQTAEKDYASSRGSGLLMSSPEVSFVTKPFRSVIDKSFRKNILENENFPSPPRTGWWGSRPKIGTH